MMRGTTGSDFPQEFASKNRVTEVFTDAKALGPNLGLRLKVSPLSSAQWLRSASLKKGPKRSRQNDYPRLHLIAWVEFQL